MPVICLALLLPMHSLPAQLLAQCQADGGTGIEWELSIGVGGLRMLLCPVTGHKTLLSGEKCPGWEMQDRLG